MEGPLGDYTRVSDEAAILCRRKDFPRAVNVLQRRRSERRRWRHAFRLVTVLGDRALDGARRSWMEGALREVVAQVADTQLQRELVVEARAAQVRFDLGAVLPGWTGRSLWRLADSLEIPMQYVALVTSLPAALTVPLDTAQVVLDFRRTAEAHRVVAAQLGATLPPWAQFQEAKGALDPALKQRLNTVRAQHEASRRWRAFAGRLLGPTDA
ncbi:MAG: hypothetical protein HY909_05745 [Deltaproteobacteria bacterium]|nr:hypothetical protein [Deltaproteobacteria bacterium]